MHPHLDSQLSPPQLLTTPKSKESTHSEAEGHFQPKYFYYYVARKWAKRLTGRIDRLLLRGGQEGFRTDDMCMDYIMYYLMRVRLLQLTKEQWAVWTLNNPTSRLYSM